MDQSTTLREIEQRIGNADINGAFELILPLLSSDKKYNYLHNETLAIKALYEKNVQEDNDGIISFDNAKLVYNQVNHRLLEVVKKVKTGNLKAPSSTKSSSKKVWIPALAIAGAILLSTLLYLGFLKKNTPITDQEQPQQMACPAFPMEKGFNILLFPFQSLTENSGKPHIAIRNRLEENGERYQLNISTGIYNLDTNDPNSYPRNSSKAAEYGAECQAQLVIWGTAEKNQNKNIIQTKYKFLNVGDNFAFKKINLKESTEIDTITSLSSIVTEGILTEELDQTILLLFGVVAHEKAANAAVISSLEQVNTIDSATILLKDMILADSYISTNQSEKAIETYDEVLTWHPNYGFALNNRGMLHYKYGNYEKAALDLSKKIELTPEDTTAILARGNAYAKLNQLRKAKSDYEKVKKMDPQNKMVNRKIKEVEAKIEAEKAKKARSESLLQSNPDNVKALRQSAESSRTLGDYRTSIQRSEQILATKPNDLKAYLTKIQSFIDLGEETNAVNAYKDALKKGFTRKQLTEASEVVKDLVVRNKL